MNELTLLRDLGTELDTTKPAPGTRHRVLSGIRTPPRRSSWWQLPATPGVRWLLPAGTAVLVAAAVAVPIGLAGIGDEPAGIDDSAASAQAAQRFLLTAAAEARTEPDDRPPADAFVYTRSLQLTRNTGELVSSTRESWQSVDGSREGMVTPSGNPDELMSLPGCRNGLPRVEAGQEGREGTMPCTTYPAYTDFPTTVPEALEALYKAPDDPSFRVSDDTAFEQAGTLLGERLMDAASRAALFEAMAQIPGVALVPNVATPTGAVGVAVTRDHSNNAMREEWIFDPEEHAVIGQRSVVFVRAGKRVDPFVAYSTGVVEKAIVKSVLLRPDGTVRPAPPVAS